MESFAVEAQANLDTRSSVRSYPIGGRETIELKPGGSAEIILASPEGLPLEGADRITADLLLMEFEPGEDTDRVNPNIPSAHITVTR